MNCNICFSSAVPWVTSGPEDVAGSLHQGLALDCEVKGYPIPGVQWEFRAENGSTRVLPSKSTNILFKEIFWVWRYSCLNVTHKKPYKRYEGKTNDLLIAFIGYVNDLNKLQHFKVSVQKSHH